MTKQAHLAIIAGIMLLLAPFSAQAELGPCKPDSKADIPDMMLCGSGNGAARVIQNSISPDRKFAFAWRDPNGPPDVEPPGDNEWLLLRLADGHVLARGTTDYFHTGTLRANRRTEQAIWSPDSRYVVRVYSTRYATEELTAFSLAGDGTRAAEADLLKLVETAARAQLKRRGRAVDNYVFAISSEGRPLTNAGVLRLAPYMFIIKQEPNASFRAELKLTRTPGGIKAKLTSIRLTEEQR